VEKRTALIDAENKTTNRNSPNCQQTMNLDPNIRLITICDINGKIMYSDYREGTENLISPEESRKSLKLAIDAWKTRSSLAPKIGRGKYVLAYSCLIKNSLA
jgi:hypothetical protein